MTHNANNLDSVVARNVSVEALPLGDPGRFGFGKRDQALKDL